MLHVTFDVFANPKSNLDCEKSLSRFERFQDETERNSRIAQFRQSRGCGGLPSPQTYRFYPFQLKTCPCTFQNRARFGHIWTLSDSFEKHGVLPFPGSLTQQPALIIEAFDVLRGLKSKYEQQRNK
jgi:hypothetical protein